MPWLDATNGGFFSFALKPVPDAANALRVTYWGGDAALGAAARHFDIFINGEKIAEQTLNSNHPGEFFDVTYPIPQALTRGKATVTVRFGAKPDAIAGGVFGVRFVTQPNP